MDTVLQILIVLTGVGGQYLVAKRNVAGFKIWILTNLLLIGTSLNHALYGMAALYFFYTLMSVYSIRSWQKTDTPQSSGA